jgi:hypothetical protein
MRLKGTTRELIWKNNGKISDILERKWTSRF